MTKADERRVRSGPERRYESGLFAAKFIFDMGLDGVDLSGS